MAINHISAKPSPKKEGFAVLEKLGTKLATYLFETLLTIIKEEDMGNLNDPKERQRFLAKAINDQVSQRKQDAEKSNMLSDTKFVGKLVDFFDDKDEKAYRQLSKRFGLWGNK